MEVPEATFEFAIEKMSQHIKRMFIVIILLIFALVGTNVAWIIYESRYETYYCDVQAEDGNANYIGNDGDIVNGENRSQEENES